MEEKVLDHGIVSLEDFPENGDLMVVNAMLVSTGKNKETEMTEQNKRRINFLLQADPAHASPFEHSKFTFKIICPIFVAREWMRHRTASFNEISGRYRLIENPLFYNPEQFRTQVGKPGEYTYESYVGDTKILNNVLENHYQDSVDMYNWMVEKGIAKEQARIVLPLAMYTEFYFTVNARNLMHFLRLRNAPEAQYEIRVYAEAMERMLAKKMPITYESWIKNERRSL